MTNNQQLIEKFYTAFAHKDYKTMQECYADNATFSDPAFVGLNSAEVRAMWEMLIKRGKDLRVEFSNVKADDKTGSADWVAYYSFSASGNKVVNRVKASFEFENGKIVKHTDVFPFYTWVKQALGTTGLLLGWTPFLKNKVQKSARSGLMAFMSKAK